MSCGVFLLQNFMNINGTTLNLIFWFPGGIIVLEILGHQNTNEESKFLTQNFHTQFLKQSMFEASEVLQKPAGSKKTKQGHSSYEILKKKKLG